MQSYGKNEGRHSANNNVRQPQNVFYGHYRVRQDTPVSVKYERITPIKPTAQPNRTASAKNSVQSRKKQSDNAVRDFLFGFTVGFVIFGTAAAIICNALLRLIY